MGKHTYKRRTRRRAYTRRRRAHRRGGAGHPQQATKTMHNTDTFGLEAANNLYYGDKDNTWDIADTIETTLSRFHADIMAAIRPQTKPDINPGEYAHQKFIIKRVIIKSDDIADIDMLDLPDNICIVYLTLSGLRIKSITDFVPGLHTLTIEDCPNLRHLPELPPLNELVLKNTGIIAIKHFPCSLQHIIITNNPVLKYVPDLPPFVKDVVLEGNPEITRIPSMSFVMPTEYINNYYVVSSNTKLFTMPEQGFKTIASLNEVYNANADLPQIREKYPELNSMNINTLTDDEIGQSAYVDLTVPNPDYKYLLNWVDNKYNCDVNYRYKDERGHKSLFTPMAGLDRKMDIVANPHINTDLLADRMYYVDEPIVIHKFNPKRQNYAWHIQFKRELIPLLKKILYVNQINSK